MASERVMIVICAMTITTLANAYMIQGIDVEVDYWTGTGANECIVVIDWNATNGPYATASHAFGYRWDGDAYVSDALAAIDATGGVDITTIYSGGFVNNVYYDQLSLDGDDHTSLGYAGWWWLGDTADAGQSWNGNGGGITGEQLWDGGIEGLNLDFKEWTPDSLTIPVPEPATLGLVALGAMWLRRRV